MTIIKQIHVYPLDIGWLHIEVTVIGEHGRKQKGMPYEYRYWLPQEVQI